MSEQTKKSDFLAKLAKKAEEDLEFREKLKANPKKIIEEILKISLPESLKIVIHEDGSDVVNLVLPPLKTEEVTDASLNNVAGGLCWGNCTCAP